MFGEKMGNRPTFPVEEGKTGPNGRPLPVVAMTTGKRKHEDQPGRQFPLPTCTRVNHFRLNWFDYRAGLINK